ncbi:universal stress protein [Thermus sediminis]|uniref:universal stress protein n=1 Tax=Thermus sediminis TaxID=1761908 RepID=UPI002FCDB7F4
MGPRLLLRPKTLPYYRELLEDLRWEGLPALGRAACLAEELGVPSAVRLLEGRAAEVTPEKAGKRGRVVMGTHGCTGPDRLPPGSRAQMVARRSPKPLLPVPHRKASP